MVPQPQISLFDHCIPLCDQQELTFHNSQNSDNCCRILRYLGYSCLPWNISKSWEGNWHLEAVDLTTIPGFYLEILIYLTSSECNRGEGSGQTALSPQTTDVICAAVYSSDKIFSLSKG